MSNLAAVDQVDENLRHGLAVKSPCGSKASRICNMDALKRIQHPPSIRINVTGAFISDDDEQDTLKTKDILLPHHTSEVSHIAVDIGGSLAKLVSFIRDPNGAGGRLTFTKFETEHIDDCIGYIASLQSKGNVKMTIMATGGGAFKFYNQFKEQLAVNIIREDEMECLIAGLDFFITEIPGEVFTYSEQDPISFVDFRQDVYPYLVSFFASIITITL